MRKINLLFIIYSLSYCFSNLDAQTIPHDTLMKVINQQDEAYFQKMLQYGSVVAGQPKIEIVKEIFYGLDTCEVLDFYQFLKKIKYRLPKDIYPYSSLFRYALKCGNVEMVKVLLKEESETKMKSLYNIDNFFLACESGSLELVQYLVKIGFPYNELNQYERSALISAVEGKNLQVVKYLVEELALNPDQIDFLGECAINYAVRNGRVGITEYLFSKKKISYKEEFIQDLFRTTAYFNDTKTFEFLLANLKLDPCSKNIFAHNIYLNAVEHCAIDTNFFNILPNNPCMNDVDTLGENIAFKCSYDSTTFKFLFSKGVDYTIYNRDGYTAAAKIVNEIVSSIGIFEELTGSDLLSIQQDILNQIYCMAKMGVTANGEDPIFYLFRHLSDNNISITSYLLKANLISGSYQNKEGVNLLTFLEANGKLKLIRLIRGE